MLRCAFLFLALLALPLKAATVTNLYQAQVVLPDTDKQSEQHAREKGLEQVLIKVSGQSSVGQNDVIRKAMANSSPYISQFGYGNLNGERTLELTFNSGQIRNLLTQAHSTLWSEQRPTILVWMVEDANREREIQWDQSGNSLELQMKKAADRRGVPLMMPIGDFDDVTAINIPDLWGGFVQPIADASMRYHPDAVLVVRARQKGSDDVDLAWQLFTQKPEQLVSSQQAPSEGQAAGSVAIAITEMINEVADRLAAKYAVPLGGASEGNFAIQLANVQTTEDFFALERMLTNLTSVASVNASRLRGDNVIFDVNLLSTEDAFRRELGQDGRISQQPADGQSAVEFGDGSVVIVKDAMAGTESQIKPIEPQAIENEPEAPVDPRMVDVSATVELATGQIETYYWQP